VNYFVAKTEAGGSAGLVWESAGPAGAIEVENDLAQRLVANFPGTFYFVDAPPAKEPAVKKTPAKAKESEPEPVADLTDALDAASAIKSRKK